MPDVINDVVINYKSVGLDKVGSEIKQTSVALDGLVVASTDAEKATASLENRFKGLERQLGTTEGNAAKFAKVQDTVSKAVGQNPALMERGNQILETARQRYLGAGEAAEHFSGQSQALLHSVRSVGEQLALGVSPVQVFTGQLSHLSYVATSPDGVTGAFKQVASMAGGFATSVAAMVTPLMAAGGVMGTFSTVAIAAGVNWANAQKDIERALAGIGRQSGTTVDDINAIGFASAKTTDLSIGEARQLATSLASTGKVSKEILAPATAAVQQLAKALGVDTTEAAKMLGTALADPIKGTEELNAKTGAFNVTTKEQIAQAMRMGDVGQAQAIMLSNLQRATENAAKANESWTDSFKDAWKWIKDTTGAMGEMTVRGAQLTRQQLGGARPTLGESTATQLSGAQRDLAGAQQDLAIGGTSAVRDVTALVQSIARLTAEVERLKSQKFGEDLAAWNAQLDRAANAATNAAKAMIPQIEQVQKLDGVISDLTRAMNIPDIGGPLKQYYADALLAAQNLRDETVRLQQDTGRYNIRVKEIGDSWREVLPGISDATAKQLEGLKNQLPVIEAITGAEKMAAQAALDFANNVNAGKSELDAAALAAAKLALSQAQANTAAEQQVKSLNDATALEKVRGTAGEKRVIAEQAYQKAIDSGADAAEAASVYTATLANETAKAAHAAGGLKDNLSTAVTPMNALVQMTQTLSDSMYNFQRGLNTSNLVAQVLADRLQDAADATAAMAANAAAIAAMSGPGGMFRAINPYSGKDLSGGTAGSIPTIMGPSGPIIANSPLSWAIAYQQQQGTLNKLTPENQSFDINAPSPVMADLELRLARSKAAGDVGGQLAALSGELGLAQGEPETAAKYQKISDLKSAIESLTKSTDSLNKTNQELLSPFYTQDPRTSHIGFRSQGMAAGGYIDVPGMPSSNDNLIASIPVASGERIYVDPMGSKRGGGGTVIQNTIHAPMMFAGNVNKDEVGRTVYQAMQAASRSLAAAAR